ncbi:BRO-G [Urbanus proteus nucleopolyhedrovirus]|uniref:BRO-G n=1 Tax=Urbanus proteus nucleopolyhedrovirus TaxID=1675866 RepID=A0A161CD22_9ABAC|nr:BRO-G [Urbanus proteus nucleopolyhedrovirus]AKR17391.1 BRO-G [Urbanus proteus nucleopolyhedrovirus]
MMSGQLERYNFPLSDVSSSSDSEFSCWAIIFENECIYYKLKEFAEALGYEDPKRAYKIIPDEWKITWNELCHKMGSQNQRHKVGPRRSHLVEPTNWQPETLMTTEAGIYSLMLRSNKPKAKIFSKFVCETILPSIRKTGRFDVRKSSGMTLVEYDKTVADLKLENMETQLALSEFKREHECLRTELALRNRDLVAERTNLAHKLSIIQKECDHKLSLVQKECDLQLSEMQKEMSQIRERYAIKEIENTRLMMTGNNALNQLGGTALLVRDTAAYGERLRKRLHMVDGRVVPDIRFTNPDKFHCLVVYYMIVGDALRVMARRIQIAQHIKDMKLMEASSTPRRRQRKASTCDEYVLNGKLLLKRDCPNPLILWNKMREANPLLFYGVRYLNGSTRTECEFMKAKDVAEKYEMENDDGRSWLSKLGVTNVKECVTKCYVEKDKALNCIKIAIDECDDSKITGDINNPPTTDNVSYTPDEVYDAVRSMQKSNSFVNITNNYFNFFGTPPPAAPQSPTLALPPPYMD